ncbi:glycosyltransferase [Roseomonas sp. HF4]|uniref:glycosyltransferase n=1 Tax=Roseomonas sp. HF4 TaxID=2562313 RepID=UPI00148594D3
MCAFFRPIPQPPIAAAGLHHRRTASRGAGHHAPTTIRCLFHPANRGKGAGVRTGLAAACGEVIVIQDADLE